MTEDQKTKVPNLYLIQNDSKMDSANLQLILDFSDLLRTLSSTHQKVILGRFISLLPESERVSLIRELLPYLSHDSIDYISEYMITLF